LNKGFHRFSASSDFRTFLRRNRLEGFEGNRPGIGEMTRWIVKGREQEFDELVEKT
jgi:hypothetical protein